MRIRRFVETCPAPTAVKNICGALVYSWPERSDQVRRDLAALSGVEVHYVTDDGKLVVTVEDTAAGWAGATVERFNTIEGVLSVALVYHHFDTNLDGEIAP